MVVFRTPSGASARNYITAAANVGSNAASIIDTVERNSPNYDQMAADAIRSNERVKDATFKQAVNNINVRENTADTIRLARQLRGGSRQKQPMAGKLAARTKGWIDAINKKDPPKPFIPDYSSLDKIISDQQAQIDSLDDRIKSRKYEPIDMNIDNNTNPNTAGLEGMGPDKGWQQVLQTGEGTARYGQDKYNVLFGGGLFSDLSKHPDQVVDGGRYKSAAAGAYQFMPETWKRSQKALNLPDFGGESQEKARRYLMKERGVDPDAPIANKQEFAERLALLAPEWASLPKLDGTSYYGQPVKSLDTLWEAYQQGRGPITSNGGEQLVYKTGNIGPTSTGDHLDVKKVGRGAFELSELTPYLSVDDPQYGRSSLADIRIKTGGIGDSQDEHIARGSHGWDVGLYKDTPVYLTGGAKYVSKTPSEHGDVVTIELPNGDQYTLLHGKGV